MYKTNIYSGVFFYINWSKTYVLYSTSIGYFLSLLKVLPTILLCGLESYRQQAGHIVVLSWCRVLCFHLAFPTDRPEN